MNTDKLALLHKLAIENNYSKLLKELRPLIYKLAIKYNLGNHHEKDIRQCGRIGLYNAMRAYDPIKSNKFFCLARMHIKREMINYINNHSRTIRIPVHQLNENNLSYNPNAPQEIKTISLSTPISENSNECLGDTIESNYNQPIELDDYDKMKLVLLSDYFNKLKPKYQLILKMRFYEEKTDTEIAKELKITSQAVNQQMNNALKKLKKLYGLK
jgi:RNA polymerase sporulation-specific sigma factor